MNQLDQILTAIAREHLGIATLKTRRSDRLDFHDVPIWGIRAALEAAYKGGAEHAGGSHPPADDISQTLNQQVDLTIKLSLCLDAAYSRSDIIGLAKSRLSAAFAIEIAAMLHPILIVGLQEEAEIYGTEPCVPLRFDAYEIQPCHRYFDADEPDMAFVEPCEPFEADFWTVYGHIPGEGVQAIGDFDTREHAEEVFARITGRSYTGRVRKMGGANHE